LIGLAAMLLMAASADDARPRLECSIGPVERTFGGTAWVVYACSDQRSVVVVSKQDNPASPFVFILSPDHGHYRIYGEGNGSKAASDAALADLKALGDDGIAKLGDIPRAVGR
jgi:hypothetical protein